METLLTFVFLVVAVLIYVAEKRRNTSIKELLKMQKGKRDAIKKKLREIHRKEFTDFDSFD